MILFVDKHVLKLHKAFAVSTRENRLTGVFLDHVGICFLVETRKYFF